VTKCVKRTVVLLVLLVGVGGCHGLYTYRADVARNIKTPQACEAQSDDYAPFVYQTQIVTPKKSLKCMNGLLAGGCEVQFSDANSQSVRQEAYVELRKINGLPPHFPLQACLRNEQMLVRKSEHLWQNRANILKTITAYDADLAELEQEKRQLEKTWKKELLSLDNRLQQKQKLRDKVWFEKAHHLWQDRANILKTNTAYDADLAELEQEKSPSGERG